MIAEKLKKSIIQAAIQGKLTEQLISDGDAKDLLKDIQNEKARLIQEGKIKKQKPLPKISEDEIPFDIPENWTWTRLASLSEPCDYPFADGPFGSNLKRAHYTDKHEVRIIQLSNIGENGWRDKNTKYTTYNHLKTISRSEVKAGDIVIAKMMPAGRAIEVPNLEKKYVLSSDAIKLVPNKRVNKSYLLNSINSDCFKTQIYAEVQGITRVRTSLSKVKTYLIPLPPENEQNRIVHLLNQLLPKIDKLKIDELKLDVLQESFPKKMKDSIMQYAIQGKLTEQLPMDGDAHCLLKELQNEKARLIQEGKIKKQKSLPKISEDEIPFDIPDNWCWVRLGEIGETNIGLTYRPSDISKNGTLVLRSGNIQNDKIDYSDKVYVNCKIPESKKCHVGDILICARNGSKRLVGKAAIIDQEGMAFGAFMARFKSPFNRYIHKYLGSPYFRADFDGVSTTTINQITQKNLKERLLPLPPLAEQKRIVERLEELLPEINKLKNYVTKTQ